MTYKNLLKVRRGKFKNPFPFRYFLCLLRDLMMIFVPRNEFLIYFTTIVVVVCWQSININVNDQETEQTEKNLYL